MTNDKSVKNNNKTQCNKEFKQLVKTLSIAGLKEMDKDQLQNIYDGAKNSYNNTKQIISRKERENLYAIQEKLFGGIDAKLQTSLENIGETLVKNPEKRKKAIDYKLPSSGAVIVKNWKGNKLEVKIVESGFEYNGESYKSLSKLAQEIAGYRVSGPIFFGLRKAKKAIDQN